MIKDKLKELTKHDNVVITSRGNTAIKAAVKGKLLIPEEGGWIEYKRIKEFEEVKCNDAVIDLEDLKEKLATGKFKAFLYQNPGGYFASQPMKEIYELCQKNGCLVILDVSGSIGTELCDGNYADIIVGSFGKWKLVEAHVGGFVSFKNHDLFEKVQAPGLEDPQSLLKIKEKLERLPERITFLRNKVKQIKEDLQDFEIVHKEDLGFVVVIKLATNEEKEEVINYCKKNELEYTICPRYIRLNQDAISIEVKRLQN